MTDWRDIAREFGYTRADVMATGAQGMAEEIARLRGALEIKHPSDKEAVPWDTVVISGRQYGNQMAALFEEIQKWREYSGKLREALKGVGQCGIEAYKDGTTTSHSINLGKAMAYAHKALEEKRPGE